MILFFSFFIQILYYYGTMQWVVLKLGWLLQVTIGTTACESVNAAANIFLGQVRNAAANLCPSPYWRTTGSPWLTLQPPSEGFRNTLSKKQDR